MSDASRKPLGHKAYGSIPHLPGSKRGPGDYGLSEQQAAIITGDRKLSGEWEIIAQEKLDGSCLSVAKIDGEIVPIGRAGYHVNSAPYEHLRLFEGWVAERREHFDALLSEGERVVGEWMLLATGLRYWIAHPDDLFVAFDIMRGHDRVVPSEVADRCWCAGISSADSMHYARGEPARIFQRLTPRFTCEAKPEGLVYRVMRNGKVSFLAKWVRDDFEAGRYLDQGVYNYPPQWLRDDAAGPEAAEASA